MDGKWSLALFEKKSQHRDFSVVFPLSFSDQMVGSVIYYLLYG